MKILVTIPHYYNFDSSPIHGSSRTSVDIRTRALTKTIMSLHQHLGKLQFHSNYIDKFAEDANLESKHDIDIIIVTEGKNHIIDNILVESTFFNTQSTNSNPTLLGFECRNVLLENKGNYDYYCYIEDDIILTDPFFSAS